MKKKKFLLIILSIIILLTLSFIFFKKVNNIELTDNVKFAKEYTKLTDNNVFVYRNIDEIINILEHGTGVVYLGFPECKWCQQYVFYLNEVAQEVGIQKIYYYNIKEDRTNNTEEYQKVVSILNNYLEYDDEGKKRIYVPDITVVINGEIIGHDNESSYDVVGEPSDYWTDYKVHDLKERLKNYMNKALKANCNTCEG